MKPTSGALICTILVDGKPVVLETEKLPSFVGKNVFMPICAG